MDLNPEALGGAWRDLELSPFAGLLLHAAAALLAGLAAWAPARALAAWLQRRSGRTRRDVNDFLAAYAEQVRSGPEELKRVNTDDAVRASLPVWVPAWVSLTHLRLAGALAVCLPGLGLGLPAPLALVAGALGWFLGDHVLRMRWQGYVARIETDLPIALARLGPELAAGTAVPTALNNLIRHEPERPLARYLAALLERMRAVGGEAALREAVLMADSISESLQTVLFLLSRVQATGGAAYGDTIESTADRLMELEKSRSGVRTQARSATVTILLIVLLLFGGLAFLVGGNPAVAASFRTPLGVAASIATGVWMMLGYVIMTRSVAGTVRM